MCKMRVVVRRECLGSREIGWSIFNGKSIQECTSIQIRNLIKSGQKVCGLALKVNDLVLDEEGFFTSNLIEHRSCDNYTPMIEGDTAVNVFYIVIGKHEESGVTYYDCISTKFEQTAFNESDVRAYLRLGIISGGARLGADDKIELASLEYEKAEETKPTEKKGAVEKKK